MLSMKVYNAVYLLFTNKKGNLEEVFKKEILRDPTIEECYFHEIEEAQRMCGQFIRS